MENLFVRNQIEEKNIDKKNLLVKRTDGYSSSLATMLQIRKVRYPHDIVHQTLGSDPLKVSGSEDIYPTVLNSSLHNQEASNNCIRASTEWLTAMNV